jgi:hypothetical protein
MIESIPFHDSRDPNFNTMKETLEEDLAKLKSRMERDGKLNKTRLVSRGQKSSKIVADVSS